MIIFANLPKYCKVLLILFQKKTGNFVRKSKLSLLFHHYVSSLKEKSCLLLFVTLTHCQKNEKTESRDYASLYYMILSSIVQRIP